VRYAITRKLRPILAGLPFKTWIRGARDGTAWVGPEYAFNMAKSEEIAALLRRHGFACELKGKPGTSGQYIVDVSGPATP